MKRLYESLAQHKSTLLVLSCLVVFVTTYVLILPAFTLEKDEAARQGGIDVPATEINDESEQIADNETAEDVTESEQTTGGSETPADIVEDTVGNASVKVTENAEDSLKAMEESAAAEPQQEISDSEIIETVEKVDTSDTESGLVFEADNYSVTVTDTNNVLPENARIEVEEITNDKDAGKAKASEYEKLYEDALKAVTDADENCKTVDFKFAKFYDISLMNGSDAIEPEDAVNVSIAYDKKLQKTLKVADTDRVRIVHFVRDEKTGEVSPEVLDSEKVEVTTDNKKMTEATFEVESFSVYAVVYTIDSTYVSASGDTYDIKVTYGEDANIPAGTELVVKEIEKDSEEYVKYVGQAWHKMNEKYLARVEANKSNQENDEISDQSNEPLYVRNILQADFFDISFVKNGKKLEPEGPVQVNIELKNGLKNTKDAETSVVHFKEDSIEKIKEVKTEGNTKRIDEISFSQDSFSVDGVITSVEANNVKKDTVSLKAVTAANRDDLEPPQANKWKTDNGDGTYKIHLSVTGDAQNSSDIKKSNIIIIMDESSSMRYGKFTKVGTVRNGVPVDFTPTVNTTYYSTENASEGGKNGDALFYSDGKFYEEEGILFTRYEEYTGEVYTFKNRLSYEQEALQALVHDLLSNNGTGYAEDEVTRLDDIVEIAVVGFNSSSWVKSDWSTNENNIMREINKDELANETHWWDALNTANNLASNKHASQPDEDVHVIFLTDGRPLQIEWWNFLNPTPDHFYDWCVPSVQNLMNLGNYIHLYNIYTYGELIDQDNGANNPGEGRYPETARLVTLTDRASAIGDATYYDASNAQELIDAFSGISANISKSVAYGRVSLKDGLTANASATTVVNGKADGFTYEVSGEKNYTVTTTGGSDPTVTFKAGNQTAQGVKKTGADGKEYYEAVFGENVYKIALANVLNNEVNWDLGGIGILEKGCTYTVSFDMWPNQEAYDTLADLNNGVNNVSWNDNNQTPVYTDETQTTIKYYKDGVEGYPEIVKLPDGSYAVLTNTDQEMSYSVVKTSSDSEEPEYGDSQTVKLPTPDPMPLEDRKVKIQKEWNDSLDPDQLNDIVKDAEEAGTPFHAELSLQKEGEDYITPVIIDPVKDDAGNVQRVWPEVDANNNAKKHDVSAGLMVSEDQAKESGLYQWISNDSKYKQVRYPDTESGTLYFILDTGHDYSFYEDPAHNDPHFELAENVFHPMLVDKVLMDVEFNEDGSIKSMETVETGNDGTATLTATNDLKGGIRVFKKVFDESGNDISKQENHDKFKIKVTLTKPDGTPYSAVASDGGYRINYGSNHPENEKEYGEGDEGAKNRQKNRSIRYPVDGGVIEIELYADDYIQVANVDKNVSYKVEEPGADIPDGYELIGIDYYKDNTIINDHPDERIVEPNTSHQVNVKNKSTLTDFTFSKAWLKVGTDLDAITDTDLLEWNSNRNISVEVKRLKADNSDDTTFTLRYDIDNSDGPFEPTNTGLTDAEKTRFRLTKVANGNITTFKLGKVLPGKYKEDDEEKSYTYYVEELSAGEGDYTSYYGTISDNAISRDQDAQHADDGGIILNMESPVELPHAGGIGTTLFYIFGTMLTLGCAVMLISKRRMRND